MTGLGDEGTTTLCSSERIRKDAASIEFIGTIDEFSSYLGVCCLSTSKKTTEKLVLIQAYMSQILGCVACDLKPSSHLVNFTAELERWGSEIDKELTPLTSFLIPGGHPAAAHLQFARTVCRRAERFVVAVGLDEALFRVVVPALNRLSDYLYLLARYENLINGIEERPVPPLSRTPHQTGSSDGRTDL
jgi:cob(I)alamin adenosyltransferase